MGDFISNNPDGKSDLHQFSSPSATQSFESDSTQPPVTPNEAENTENTFMQASSPVPESVSEASSEPLDVSPFHSQASPQNSQPQATYPPQYPPQYQSQYSQQYPPQNNYGLSYNYAIYGQDPPGKNPKEKYNIASLILGIASWVGLILCCGCFSPFTAIASLITAFIGKENGKFSGKAVAGIIMSIIFLVIFTLFMGIMVLGLSGAFDEPEVGGDFAEMMITIFNR